MAYQPVGPVAFGKYGNTGAIDVSQFSRTGSAYSDPSLFALMLKKSMSSSALDILFGDEDSQSQNIFGSSSILGGNNSSISDPLSELAGGAGYTSDLSGLGAGSSSLTPQIEMIAKSNLIGKTVSAINPLNNQRVQGKVESISVSNGVLLFNLSVSGTTIRIPPENLLSVSE